MNFEKIKKSSILKDLSLRYAYGLGGEKEDVIATKAIDPILIRSFLSIFNEKLNEFNSAVNGSIHFKVVLSAENFKDKENKRVKYDNVVRVILTKIKEEEVEVLKIKNNEILSQIESKTINNEKIVYGFDLENESKIKTIRIDEEYLLMKELLKETIYDFLKSKSIMDLDKEDWPLSIKYCSFLQAFTLQGGVMQDALFELMIAPEFLKSNFAYQVTIFRAMKYSNEPSISLYKGEAIRKIMNTIKILLNNNLEHDVKYLFNGFYSQINLSKSYNFDIENPDIVEMVKDVNSQLVLDKILEDNQRNIVIADIEEFSKTVKKKRKGDKVDYISGKLEVKDFLKIEVNTVEAYETTGFKKIVDLKKIYDSIIFDIIKKSDYLKDMSIYLNDEALGENKYPEEENLKNNIYMHIKEEDLDKVGKIKTYIDELLQYASVVINDILITKYIDMGEKEKNMSPTNSFIKTKDLFNQTRLIMKADRNDYILSNLRERSLLNKIENEIMKKTKPEKKKKI